MIAECLLSLRLRGNKYIEHVGVDASTLVQIARSMVLDVFLYATDDGRTGDDGRATTDNDDGRRRQATATPKLQTCTVYTCILIISSGALDDQNVKLQTFKL